MVEVAEDKGIEFKRACGAWAIINRDYMPETTKHGLVLTRGGRAEMEKETASGTVVHVGDGSNPFSRSQESKPNCEPGERVFWDRMQERVLEVRDEGDLVAVPFPAIMGVLC